MNFLILSTIRLWIQCKTHIFLHMWKSPITFPGLWDSSRIFKKYLFVLAVLYQYILKNMNLTTQVNSSPSFISQGNHWTILVGS